MKVVVDMQKLTNLYSGLGQFCLNLGKELIHQNKYFDLLFLGEDKNYLGENVKFFQPGLIEKLSGNFSDNIDVWHCTHQEPGILPGRKVKLILTIHDLNFLYKYKSEWRINVKLSKLQKIINRASAIAAVSEFTLKEVKNHFFIPDIPQQVIYNGIALDFNVKAVKPSFVPDSPFLFTLGIISPKKNFHVLLPFIKKTNYKLIIAGDKATGYAKDILKIAGENDISDLIIIPGKITEEEKRWLYNNCEAFVFPSLSEGFGLPVAEAMSLGKPVFLSDKTSLPEIGGDVAFYWENFDPEYMVKLFSDKMNLYNYDLSYKNKLINQGKRFSWSVAALQYLALYRLLADKTDKKH